MKILLVIERDTLRDAIIQHLSPRGFDFITYSNPVKAIDNIPEIAPDIVIFSSVDFPRHWKPFLKVLRLFKSRDESIFVLLKSENFSVEESTKAAILGVNAIIPDNLEDPLSIQQLKDIFSRFTPASENRLDRRYLGVIAKDIEFIFNHPISLQIVTGILTDISLGGISFKPDVPRLTQDIMEGIVLENCTLRINENFYMIPVKVIRNNIQISLGFIEPSDSLNYDLLEYFNTIPTRELEKVLHHNQEEENEHT